jgi:hypothetical protein
VDGGDFPSAVLVLPVGMLSQISTAAPSPAGDGAVALLHPPHPVPPVIDSLLRTSCWERRDCLAKSDLPIAVPTDLAVTPAGRQRRSRDLRAGFDR